MTIMPKPRRVAEPLPVQVYLDSEGRERLDRLADQLDATKSDVLRRALSALERELTDPAQHPALAIIGLAGAAGRDDVEVGYAVAVEHDRALADAEEARWRGTRGRRKRRGR
jgi:predicted transcriptional regulator